MEAQRLWAEHEWTVPPSSADTLPKVVARLDAVHAINTVIREICVAARADAVKLSTGLLT
jgi:hypothetical protein